MDFDAKFFFSFMRLGCAETSSGLSFTNLCSKGCSLDQAAFLQLQCALLHHWVDKFKTLSEDGTFHLLATLPTELHVAELIRTDVLCYNLVLLCTVLGLGGYNAICEMLPTCELSCGPMLFPCPFQGMRQRSEKRYCGGAWDGESYWPLPPSHCRHMQVCRCCTGDGWQGLCQHV